jgi:hypothetical protein
MTSIRTALQKEMSDQIGYGEALLIALRLKAQRQLEIVTPHQHEDLVALYRLMLDIQAVQDKLGRELYRLSVCRWRNLNQLQERKEMSKVTMNENAVLQMALVGYELQRDRIESAMKDIRAELGDAGSSRSNSTALTTAEPKTPSKKRFSAAVRRRMAAAQKKRWALKAKKTQAKKTKPTVAPKRRKANAAPIAKKRPVPVKAAKNAVPRAKDTLKPKHHVAVVEVSKAVPPSELRKRVPEPQVLVDQPAAVVTQ